MSDKMVPIGEVMVSEEQLIAAGYEKTKQTEIVREFVGAAVARAWSEGNCVSFNMSHGARTPLVYGRDNRRELHKFIDDAIDMIEMT